MAGKTTAERLGVIESTVGYIRDRVDEIASSTTKRMEDHNGRIRQLEITAGTVKQGGTLLYK